MTEDLLLNLPPGTLGSGVPAPYLITPAAARLLAGAKTGGLKLSLEASRLIAQAEQIQAGIATYPDDAVIGVPVGGGGAWTPAEIGDDLLFWWDSTLPVYSDALGTTPATDGQQVKFATDGSGKGNHWKEWATVTPPVLDIDGINGLPALVFSVNPEGLKLDAPVSTRAFIFVGNYAGATFSSFAAVFGISSSDPALFGGYSGQTTLWPPTSAANKNYVNGVATDEFAPISTTKIAAYVRLSTAKSTDTLGRAGTDVTRDWVGPLALVMALASMPDTTLLNKIGQYANRMWGVDFLAS